MSDAPEDPGRQRHRLRWQCRRGMLELDLLLGDFVERGYDALDPPRQQLFEALLGYPDQLLHDWLIQRLPPADDALRALVADILTAVVPVSGSMRERAAE